MPTVLGSQSAGDGSPRVTIIRQAVADEAPVVAGLWTEAAAWLAGRGIDQWQYPPHLDRITASIAAGECWVAVDGVNRDLPFGKPDRPVMWSDRPIGTITVDGRADPEFWTEADAPDMALYAHRMAVDRSAAGTGLGARLLDHAGRLAAETGRRWLRLDCWRDNPGLAGYYRSQGFVQVRTVVLEHRRSGVLFQRPAG